MSFQKIIVAGNLGSDAEVKIVKGDKELVKFRLAQSDRFTQQTNWFNVEFWRGGAIAQYLVKGQTVIVEGRVRLEQWESKAGKAGASMTITADDVRLMGSRGHGPQGAGAAAGRDGEDSSRDDTIPF